MTTPHHTAPSPWPANKKVALVAALGLALGAAGVGSYALWQDRIQMTTSISSGYQYFSAGLLNEPITANQAPNLNTVTVPSGWEVAAAQTLLDTGSVAVVFETHSLSQGNKGLVYEIFEPESWGTGVFSYSDVSLYWVDTPEECAPGVARPEAPDTVYGHLSRPISATYSESATAVIEYWCLNAQYTPPPPPEGRYQNTATVTGEDPNGDPLSDTDSWRVNLYGEIDAGEQEPLPISFTYNTFRPDPSQGPIDTVEEDG